MPSPFERAVQRKTTPQPAQAQPKTVQTTAEAAAAATPALNTAPTAPASNEPVAQPQQAAGEMAHETAGDGTDPNAPAAPTDANEGAVVPTTPQAVAPAQDAAAVVAAPVATVQTETHTDMNAQGATRKHYVLTSTGTPQFDGILSGSVGTLTENGAFQIDPDYKKLCYLFSLADTSRMPSVIINQATPVETIAAEGAAQDAQTDAEEALAHQAMDDMLQMAQSEKAFELQLSDSAYRALKATMIQLCNANWMSMYDSLLKQMPSNSLNSAMLGGDRDNVARGVSEYLRSQALPAWDVPTIYKAVCYDEQPGERPATELALMTSSKRIGPILPDVLGEARPHAEAQAEENALPQRWKDHIGAIEMTIDGSMTVLAENAQDAKLVAFAILQMAPAMPQLQKAIQTTPQSIQQVTLMAPTYAELDDDDDDNDRGHYQRDR